MEDIKKIHPLPFGFDDNIRDETETAPSNTLYPVR